MNFKVFLFQIKGRINVIYYCRQPGKSIAEVAKDEKCGLIVLGRRFPFIGNPSNSTTLDYLLKKSNYPISVVIKPDPVEDDANSLTSLSSAIVQPQPKRNSIMNLGILPKIRRTSCPATNIMEMAEGEQFKGNLLHSQLRALTQEQERRHSTHVTPLSSDKVKSFMHKWFIEVPLGGCTWILSAIPRWQNAQCTWIIRLIIHECLR